MGGFYQTNALAGDGQVPVRPVEAARQREALDLLMEALSPANLDVPEAALASLVPPPSGMARSREEFAAETGAAFSPLTAARVLAGLVVRPLLDPQRAARLTLASGKDALTLDAVLGRLLDATWTAPAAPEGRRSVLQRVAQREVLDAMMDLAADDKASPEVRAVVTRRLSRLATRLGTLWRKAEAAPGTDEATVAHQWMAWRDLTAFLERPEVRRSRPRPPLPPGRPIGSAPWN